MAVIEQEPEVETPEVVKPSVSTSPAAGKVERSDDATTSGVATGVGVEDGFETASEGEVGGETSDDETEKKDENQRSEVEKREADVVKVEEEDEELKQKALEEANDAKAEGNKLYVEGQFVEALSKYELALQIVQEMPSLVELRSICHFNRSTCFSKLGKYEDTVKECRKALELNPSYMKALVRKADAHEKLENFEEALADLNKILELDPSNSQARITKRRLEPLAAEKREKMKEEMIGKLKEMGNSLLGRFGMSVDNFKTVQDPSTGAYSIQFQR